MNLEAMKRRLEALERHVGAAVVALDVNAPDFTEALGDARARAALVVLVDRDEPEEGEATP